jgi:hypothetical protein
MSIYLGLADRVKEFDQRHGGDPVAIGHWLVFPDGAQREANPAGAWVEPPQEPHQQAQLILRYQEERLRQAQAAFEQLKSRLQQQASQAVQFATKPTPPQAPSEEEVAELRALQALVHERRQARDAAQANTEQMKSPKLREREAEAAAHAERGQAALDVIKTIRI